MGHKQRGRQYFKTYPNFTDSYLKKVYCLTKSVIKIEAYLFKILSCYIYLGIVCASDNLLKNKPEEMHCGKPWISSLLQIPSCIFSDKLFTKKQNGARKSRNEDSSGLVISFAL